MANKKAEEVSTKDRQEFENFTRLTKGMDDRRQQLLAEAHRRAEMELYQYRLTVFTSLRKLLAGHSVSQIAKHTGLARSTIYRWTERLRNDELVSEAASRGIFLDKATTSNGVIGGLGGAAAFSGGGEAPPEHSTSANAEDLGWTGGKRLVSGEIAATDLQGRTWLFNDSGSAWNKTDNEEVQGRENWPAGAGEVFDILNS